MGQRKEELLGVAFNRLMRMDITTGDHVKTWRFNTMKASCLKPIFLLRNFIHALSLFKGVERQLGGEAHDGPVRGGERRVQLPLGGL